MLFAVCDHAVHLVPQSPNSERFVESRAQAAALAAQAELRIAQQQTVDAQELADVRGRERDALAKELKQVKAELKDSQSKAEAFMELVQAQEQKNSEAPAAQNGSRRQQAYTGFDASTLWERYRNERQGRTVAEDLVADLKKRLLECETKYVRLYKLYVSQKEKGTCAAV